MATKAENVDEYIAAFPKEVQNVLQDVRETIKKIAPQAQEVISYAIPAFKLNGKGLIHYAGYKNHIGFYPAPTGDEAFNTAIAIYKSGKSTIQFPLDKPMPLNLISQIVKLRIDDHARKASAKK